MGRRRETRRREEKEDLEEVRRIVLREDVEEERAMVRRLVGTAVQRGITLRIVLKV